MGRKKQNKSGKVISVRVNGEELESLQRIMVLTRRSASNVMREAIRQLVAPALESTASCSMSGVELSITKRDPSSTAAPTIYGNF